jgi:hypothetical protein
VPPLIPRREHFTGPERLSPAWTLTKARKEATCEVWLHEFGFELRLLIVGELVQSRLRAGRLDSGAGRVARGAG